MKYANLSEQQLPESTSSRWAGRPHRNEKWRQLGEFAISDILSNLTQHLKSGSPVLLVRCQALPTDWLRTIMKLDQARAII